MFHQDYISWKKVQPAQLRKINNIIMHVIECCPRQLHTLD